jgi:peptidoglycan hydrolase CwlO-like protein
MVIPWGDVAAGTVAGFAIGWRIYDGIREKRLTKQYGIKENPARCGEHEKAINLTNLAIVGIQKDIESIKEDVNEIKNKINAPYPRG